MERHQCTPSLNQPQHSPGQITGVTEVFYRYPVSAGSIVCSASPFSDLNRFMNIYISNLGDRITDESLDATFSTYGTVTSTTVVRDGFNGYPRGVAYVEMPNEAEAIKAIQRLNGSIIDGRFIEVAEARPRSEVKEDPAGRA